MGGNGYEADQPLLERMISAVARFNELARGLGDSLDYLSQQQAQGLESVRKEVREESGKVRDDVEELRELVVRVQVELGIVREDTNPRMRLPPAHEGQPPQRNGKDSSGGALVYAAKLAEKVPTPWVAGLLKLGVSSGLGALALRLIQWLANGH